ncbi:hypothetical protein OIU77_015301 [Salix suchowensis]|uniref:DNA topoisomerase (ATP-hydrolyzing) n=1 Tax=Salix suchowensis TaxID=1278906 RepID=A0ABQ8ZSA0_9ROSI|nr:hypothetical protein OIU77_015301 [Salix suchowensis]
MSEDSKLAQSSKAKHIEAATLSAEEMGDMMGQLTYIMHQKFLAGEDHQHLDYSKIDDDETLDDHWLREANHDAEDKYFAEGSNYDDAEKKTTGGRNGYGAKLTNIFSTEFVIETADGKRQKKYKQVFSNNMGGKYESMITKCKEGENWTKVTFKPDLAKFSMSHLEEDVVALMKKRVVDMAGCLGKTEGRAKRKSCACQIISRLC